MDAGGRPRRRHPDYARERVFERFYSLARPGSGRRSSGLGLPFVQEVARLHDGRASVDVREAAPWPACGCHRAGPAPATSHSLQIRHKPCSPQRSILQLQRGWTMKSLKMLLRFAIVGGLILLLLVPLTMIRGVINERSAYRDEAFSRVADSRAGAQQLVGPVRVVPWVERKQVELVDPLGVKKTEVQVTEGHWLQMPASLMLPRARSRTVQGAGVQLERPDEGDLRRRRLPGEGRPQLRPAVCRGWCIRCAWPGRYAEPARGWQAAAVAAGRWRGQRGGARPARTGGRFRCGSGRHAGCQHG